MVPPLAGLSRLFLFLLILINSDLGLSVPQQVAPSGTTTLRPSSSTPVSRVSTGTIVTSLERDGNPSSQPFPTQTQANAPFSVTKIATSTVPPNMSANFLDVAQVAINPFLPVATTAPPSSITRRDNHPAPRIGIVPQNSPLQTNKFYANLFLGGQNEAVWSHPYSVAWSKGTGSLKSWGLAITHIEASQRAYTAANTKISGSPPQAVFHPLGVQQLIMSATELGTSTVLTTDTLDTFSVNANLFPRSGSASRIRFPLVQGMGYVTGTYSDLRPAIQSAVFMNTVTALGASSPGIFRYRIALADGKTWLMYVIPTNGVRPTFTLNSQTLLQGPLRFNGTIQLTKNPVGTSVDPTFDASAGTWPISATLAGTVDGTTGSYSLTFRRGGNQTRTLLMYALPHHQSSFSSTTRAGLKNIKLATTTKGDAAAVVANAWTMVESNLPTKMGFAPWSPDGRHRNLSATAIAAVKAAAEADIKQDMLAQSNINSFYFAGKALSKFAYVVWAARNLANAPDVATTGLAKLKEAFAVWALNRNQFPLVYETSWKGVVSSAWTDSGADFGNSFYNDHHFHFAYFIHAAAMIGTLDPAWAQANKDYINTMVRDSGNPSKSDNFFPQFRGFDWYHGHSWAKGLFASADGKDQESSSEDVMYAYALKMWGNTIGDASMEARGNLMLGVLRNSLNKYFLMASDNTVQPPRFIPNKVPGILFENKMDHVTYFGANLEYVQGIQMLPLTSASVYSRPTKFVQEEWNVYFGTSGAVPVDTVAGGWRGVLYANYALINPVSAYKFFSASNFDPQYLDGGASRTWYLAFAAGLGGA